MIGLSNGRRAGLARQSVEWWTSPTDRRARVRGPVENDASMEIRKQRGFPQAARLRRISHRPDGGKASPPTCFQEAAIHLKIGNFLSEEWGRAQGLRLYSILATAKIGPLQQAPTGTKAHHQAPLSRLMFLLENASAAGHRRPASRRPSPGGTHLRAKFSSNYSRGHRQRLIFSGTGSPWQYSAGPRAGVLGSRTRREERTPSEFPRLQN